MKKTLYYFVIILTICCSNSSLLAQCLLQPVPLETKIKDASIIVEGMVIQQESFWIDNPRRIVTKNTIEVFKSFKGNFDATIDFYTDGGRVGNEIHVIEPNVSVTIGDKGMFFLQNDKVNGNLLVSVGSPHGFYKYDEVSGSANAPFALVTNVKMQLYTPIVTQTKQQFQIVKPFELLSPSKKTVQPSSVLNVSAFEPPTVTAGTGDELRIIGNGFGNSGTLAFRDPDNGGANFVNVHPSNIRSWSNSQIVVRVPSKAGTGTVLINGIQSTIPIEIIYNTSEIPAQTNQQGTFSAALINILSSNRVGGITFSPSTSFKNNAPAYSCFLRAMETWRCGTNINFTIAPNATTRTTAIRDGVNIAMFDDTQPLPNGVLGVTQSYYNQCQETGDIFVEEIDFRFDNTPSGGWNFGPNPTNGGRIDFQSVATHEMGHAHQLTHVNDNQKVMNWSIGPNTDLRVLNIPSDIGGGTRVLSRSAGKSCSVSDTFGVLRKVPTDGCLLSLPVADFRGDKTTGCSPLTINFTDLSKNTPLTYNWDFNNDGTVDATTVDPSFTFTTPGTYNVRLTVTNAFGGNTATKNAYITVSEGVEVAVLKDTTICNGDSLLLYAIPQTTASVNWANPIPGPDKAKETVVVRPTTNTQYSVSITGNGCTRTFNTNVTVAAKPTKPTVTAVGTTQIRSTGLLAKRYYWYLDGELLPAFTSSTITPTVTGEYTSQWENQAGCISPLSEAFKFTAPPVSVSEIYTSNVVMISPNPVKDKLIIQGNGEMITGYEIFNILGHTVMNIQSIQSNSTNKNSIEVTVSSLPQGMYILKTVNRLGVFYSKFIKQ
jgi:PKD repeat protein